MDDRTTADRGDVTRPPSGEVLAAQIELAIAADARASAGNRPTSTGAQAGREARAG